MSKPDLLLLDEPFSNVDESLKVELQQNIKKILKEKNYYNYSYPRLLRGILYGRLLWNTFEPNHETI